MNTPIGGYISPIELRRKVFDNLKRLVLVRVPRLALYSEAELENFGLPGVFVDGKLDRKQTVKEMDTVMLPISRLIDINYDGFPIFIKDSNEIPHIAESIAEALELLKYSVSTDDNLLKEKMELFLENVLDINKDYIQNKIKEEIEEDDFGEDMFVQGPTGPKIDISKLEV